MKREKLETRFTFMCSSYTKKQLDALSKFYNEPASRVITRIIQEQHLRLKIKKENEIGFNK